jgi:hypothetical protein
MTFYRTSGPTGTRSLLSRPLPTIGNRAFAAPGRAMPASNPRAGIAPVRTAAAQSLVNRQLGASASRVSGGAPQQRFARGFGTRQKFAVTSTDANGNPVIELDPGEAMSIGLNPDSGAVTVSFVPAPEEPEAA